MSERGRSMRAAADVRRVAVVGAGVIGSSWAALALLRGLEVIVVDASPAALDALTAGLEGLVGTPVPDGRLETSVELERAATSDLVIEAVSERLPLKHSVFAALDELLAADVVLASSTSALTASAIQTACSRHSERVLVAHPFNPPHLMPLVEVVAGAQTCEEAVTATIATMAHWGKRPVRLHQELPGHLANRLQAALWREAYHLVATGAASAAQIDEVVTSGPGLRWAFLGPFATQHLSGGPGGFAQLMEHLGPVAQAMWDQLGDIQLTPSVSQTLVASVEEEFEGIDIADLARRRDATLGALLALKQDHTL